MHFNPELYQEKYRIKSARAEWWEYYEGIYHIIICTNKREHYFGEITCSNGKNVMHLTEIGKFVNVEIPKMMNHYSYAYVPEWVVMPDHIHILILIDRRGRHDTSAHDDEQETRCDASRQMSAITPKKGALGVIIGRFKQAVTRFALSHQIIFKWQSRYYDKILFDQTSFDRTRRYIQNNVAKWHLKHENVLPDLDETE